MLVTRVQFVILYAAARPGDRHTSLALYILLRGITLLIRCGNKPDAPPVVRKALTPTRWKHGDTALMCLATSQITYSWIMMPHTLPKSYVKFLNKHGGRQQWHYDAAKVRLATCNQFPRQSHTPALDRRCLSSWYHVEGQTHFHPSGNPQRSAQLLHLEG